MKNVREGERAQNPKNLAYVIDGCPLALNQIGMFHNTEKKPTEAARVIPQISVKPTKVLR